MELYNLEVTTTSGVRAGRAGCPNISFSFWEQLNEIRSAFRKQCSTSLESGINLCFWQLTTGGDPATQWYSWARVKDVKLTANSGQHAEKMWPCSRMMTKADRWNFPRMWGYTKIPIIQYWCGTNAIISRWGPVKGRQTNKPSNREAIVCPLTLC